MPVALREATLEDAAAIVALLDAVGLGSSDILVPATRYWVAERNGALIGTVGLEFGPAAVLLRSAGVLASERGQGIGTALLHAALAAAREQGIATVYLFSTDAGAYWERQGFVEVPVPELVAALPAAPQVRHYDHLGWLPTEVAWRKNG